MFIKNILKMKEINEIDCPLCGAKKAIKRVPRRERTYSTATHNLGGPKIGAYHRESTGGGFSLNHASKCPSLKKTFKPRQILAYHINQIDGVYAEGISITQSNWRSFEQFERLFNKKGFEFVFVPDKENKLKDTAVYILHTESGEKLLKTKGRVKDDCFTNLKSRLLCGEFIELSNGKKYQMKSAGDSPFGLKLIK